MSLATGLGHKRRNEAAEKGYIYLYLHHRYVTKTLVVFFHWFFSDLVIRLLLIIVREKRKMDRYHRVEKPKAETPIDENEIRITSQGRMRSYITYAMSLLQVCFLLFVFF